MHQKENKLKQAVFVCDSQPIHVAEIIGALSANIQSYDRFFVCVSKNEKVMAVQHVVSIWTKILEQHKNVVICGYEQPFYSITELPDLFKQCDIFTIDKRVFTHLSSLNISVKLMPRIQGYHGTFLRAAYRQGKALDFLTSNMKRINTL